MSIATMRGDGGDTGLAGGIRVPKNHDRVEVYGTIDELISSLGFARSICDDEELRTAAKLIQRQLFSVGSAIATPPESAKKPPVIVDEWVDALTARVHAIEAVEGVLADWSIPGEHTAAAAFDVARTVCRRAERLAVGIARKGIEVQPNVLRYLNRLSDLLWLFGRLLEFHAGVDARLRDPNDSRPRWSRAW